MKESEESDLRPLLMVLLLLVGGLIVILLKSKLGDMCNHAKCCICNQMTRRDAQVAGLEMPPQASAEQESHAS